MSKYVFIFSSVKIQKRDYKRYGVKYLKKKKKVLILDLSNLLNNRSSLIYKKFVSKDILEINRFKDLIIFFQNKKNSYAIDYLGNSFKEILIRLILVWFNIKIIKYLGTLRPPILFKHINRNNKAFRVDQRTTIKKIRDAPNYLINLVKKKILILINSHIIDTLIVAGKKIQNIDFNIDVVKKVLYSHTYNYNSYLELNRKKKKNLKKIILFI